MRASNVADFGEFVVEQDVGKFVGDVAVASSAAAQRVGDDDAPAADVKRAGRECESLDAFEFFEPTAVDEPIGINDGDAGSVGELFGTGVAAGGELELAA